MQNIRPSPSSSRIILRLSDSTTPDAEILGMVTAYRLEDVSSTFNASAVFARRVHGKGDVFFLGAIYSADPNIYEKIEGVQSGSALQVLIDLLKPVTTPLSTTKPSKSSESQLVVPLFGMIFLLGFLLLL